MTFQLDTTGVVDVPNGVIRPMGKLWRWSDLTPFAQGYVEALFASELPDGAQLRGNHISLGFSDLAPETLARIIADCEAFQQTPAFVALCAKIVLHDREMMNAGQEFYYVRSRREDYCHGFKANDWPQFTAEPLNIAARAFPPLTVSLNDAGKAVFS